MEMICCGFVFVLFVFPTPNDIRLSTSHYAPDIARLSLKLLSSAEKKAKKMEKDEEVR